MINAAQLPLRVHFIVSAIAGAALGACLGIAQAQDRSLGEIDAECSSRCTANGYDAEFCGQVCWIPDPAMVAKGEGLDWKCMTSCRDRGGKMGDCLPSCQRP